MIGWRQNENLLNENNDITKEEAVELTIYLCKYNVTNKIYN